MATKSANVILLENLNNFYLNTNYSADPNVCMVKANETLLQILETK
jgi:hypothetical protein